MEVRERWLTELPVAALRLHAEECGINITGCVEKRQLVERILRSEPASFHAVHSPLANSHGSSESHANSMLANSLARNSQRRDSSQSQSDLRADEELARRLQAEEDSRSRRSQANPAELLSRLVGAREAAGQSGSSSVGRRVDAGARQSTRDRDAGMSQLLEVLALRRDARAPGAARRVDGQRDGQHAVHEPAEPDVGLESQALISLLGHVMQRDANGQHPGGRSGAVAEIHALTELLGRLMPNRGIESDALDSRTATMTFSGEGTSAGSGGEENKCMVCLEDFQGNDQLRILPCLHRYHQTCVDTWLQGNRHCPVCKHDVTQ